MRLTRSCPFRTVPPSKEITMSPGFSPAFSADPPGRTEPKQTPIPAGTPRIGRSACGMSRGPIPMTAIRASRRSTPRSQTERRFSSALRHGSPFSESGSATQTLVSAPDSLTRSNSIRASSPRRVGRRTSLRPSTRRSTVVSSRIPNVLCTMNAPPTRRSISPASPNQ